MEKLKMLYVVKNVKIYYKSISYVHINNYINKYN